ncbi:YybH family protein [Kutzneria sp. CA-103260]|uniref:YybH family protein n=1 Tax=Kutzneria sp. CA-103260 TaxID=2802641 RepID=UPI001BA9D856|nr:nuclear transport factor 2 family protein [Kutzneria sp. CA-103260]QUQ64810.1 ketosteroid isomerase-like protein [Kutzneria sp. CA-103260]
MSDIDEIRDVITAAETALKNKDAHGVLDRYTTDVAKFDLAPPLGRSGDDARDLARQQAWFETFDGPVDLQVTELEIEVGGGLAWAHSLNRLSATPKGTDFAFELWYRASYGLRRTEQGWRIAHEHSSTPFHMDGKDGSFRAATDLKP